MLDKKEGICKCQWQDVKSYPKNLNILNYCREFQWRYRLFKLQRSIIYPFGASWIFLTLRHLRTYPYTGSQRSCNKLVLPVSRSFKSDHLKRRSQPTHKITQPKEFLAGSWATPLRVLGKCVKVTQSKPTQKKIYIFNVKQNGLNRPIWGAIDCLDHLRSTEEEVDLATSL